MLICATRCCACRFAALRAAAACRSQKPPGGTQRYAAATRHAMMRCYAPAAITPLALRHATMFILIAATPRLYAAAAYDAAATMSLILMPRHAFDATALHAADASCRSRRRLALIAFDVDDAAFLRCCVTIRALRRFSAQA